MKNKPLCSRLLLLSLLAMSPPASALCVLCTCTASATGVSFGTYNPFSSSNVNATGNVRVTCGGVLNLSTVDYSIALNTGSYSSSFNPRQMGNGANRLNYNLYTTNSYVTIWGDSTGGTGVVTGTVTVPALLGSGYTDNTVYGSIPGSQTSTVVGAYSDTITVTVTYQ